MVNAHKVHAVAPAERPTDSRNLAPRSRLPSAAGGSLHIGCIAVLALMGIAGSAQGQNRIVKPQLADGFRGIWYANQASKDEYRYKYSGGLGTYPQQHLPIAVYSEEARKTFFVFGGAAGDGTNAAKRSLLIEVAYYDHATRQVCRPRVLIDKKTDDAHDNPTIMLDRAGHVWVIAPSHGTARTSYLFRSIKPHDIDAFEIISETNFSYPQPWWIDEFGFVFLHTRYVEGRRILHLMTSPDGREWSKPAVLAAVEKGHYQVSWPCGRRLGTAFNMHPDPVGLNARTNLYYVETPDGGASWRNIQGEPIALPLREKGNAALVRDYQAEGKLVYLKDINYDAKGRPVLVYVVSGGYESGPKNDPRTWTTAHWTGQSWEYRPVTQSDNNYDTGCLHVERDGTWRLIAPTTTGPQAYNPGGEVVMWTSHDEGTTWIPKALTADSTMNHTYMRRPRNASPDFYALWADGDARKPSVSHLYFCTQAGAVFKLPWTMSADLATPQKTHHGDTERTEKRSP